MTQYADPFAKPRYFKAVFPGKYIQGENVLTELPSLINLLGHNGLIIASPSVISKILPQYGIVESPPQLSIERFDGECCEREIERMMAKIKQINADVVIGIGGGKTIDTSKIAADRMNLPMIIVPTIASTDAPCSGCAVIYSEKGVFESVHYMKMNPQVVLVDTKVISNAPSRFLVSGMGDALATWFEAKSCDRSQSQNECGGYSTMTGISLARLCYDTLLEYGLLAKIACENHIVTPALNHIIEANILLSGIGFESSGLATAHSVHNGLSCFEETHAYYHGEKVSFGVLTGLHFTDSSLAEIEQVYSFCESIGLPTTFAEIGINKYTREMLMDVAIKACAPAEGIHHEAFHVCPEKIVDAMIAADSFGRYRKKL